MSTEAREPGQRAYEAWSSDAGDPRDWHSLSEGDRATWRVVEQACATEGVPMKRELDAYTLRAVARWHRRQFRLNPFPSGWEAHLVSYKHWLERARKTTPATLRKPATKAKRKGRRPP